jgi:sigma-B regulation protein RsbU (phosphoserine phosphatase)
MVRGISDWLSRISIRRRLLLYLLLGMIPIVLTTVYFFQEVYQARKGQVLLGHMATARATAGTVLEFIQGIVRAQDVMALTIVRENMDYRQMDTFFQEARNEIPLLETTAFALPSGKVVAGQPPSIIGTNIADRRYFREVASGKDWAVSDILEKRPTGEPVLIVAQRVTRDGRLVGVLFSAFSPSILEQFVTGTMSPGTGYGILDSRGRIIATTVLGPSTAAENPDRSWLSSVQGALRGKPSYAEPFLDKADGVVRMGASVPVGGIGWVVNVLEPVSTAMAPVRRAAFMDLLMHLAIIIVLVAVAWMIGTSLSRPIKSLARKADAVARGDFSQRMEIWDQAELGALANAFNNMTVEIERARIEGRKARERASFLADMGELLGSTLDPEVMLQTVARKSAEFFGDFVAVFRLGADGRLDPVAVQAQDDELTPFAQQIMTDGSIRVGLGVVGAAVERNQTVYVPRVADLEDAEMRSYLEKGNVISSVAVPMKVHGQIVGALSVSSVRQPVLEEQVPIVEELARRLGIALENIGLYEDSLNREEFQRGLAQLAVSVGTSLDPSVVLDEICSRSLELLDADGVYIWVLDEDRDNLMGASACGYNAEEFVGMTLPLMEVDTGAVQALRRREGFYVHEMPAWQDLGPLLTQKFDAQSSMFQPLLSGGKALGVMVVTDTDDPEHFDERSLARAGLLAAYAATALANASSYQRERRIAETLQRGLLPEIPERIPNFELAHFYTPAWQEAAIGGDFYDFMEVGKDVYGLEIGDVSGKGLEAAVVTAMAKYVIRAYAAEDAEPAVVLERTNNAIVKYTESELFITLVYGVLNTKTRRFRYGSAGHEPMLVYRARENAVAYEDPHGTAAGLIPDEEYLTRECALEPGDMIVMYTDGLTDARSPQHGFLGHDYLAKMVLELACKPAREFLQELMKRVQDYVGGEFADDIAVLVVRASP